MYKMNIMGVPENLQLRNTKTRSVIMWKTKERNIQVTLQLWREKTKNFHGQKTKKEEYKFHRNQVLIPRAVQKITTLVQT